MIVIPLPFNMGKVVPSANPMYGDKIDHPILDIGISVCGLRLDVREWLQSNCGDWEFFYLEGYYRLCFHCDEDAITFRLRWL